MTLLEEDFALLLDFAELLEDFALLLDRSSTGAEDDERTELLEATLDDERTLLLDFGATLEEDDFALTLEEDFALDEEFDFTELLLASSQSSQTLDEESSPGPHETALVVTSSQEKETRDKERHTDVTDTFPR